MTSTNAPKEEARSRWRAMRDRVRAFQQRPVQTEESIPLRVSVQLLVSVGIVATDVAAGTANSLWAVPLGGIGAWWSWHRRRKNNWLFKTFLAFAMLGILALFFTRMFGQLNDTRLVLAELLIQLQVLHSFDLPRRKDLGYSTLIGLILLAVSATLSQTLTFAPFLVVFLAIALPCLMLDYRSQLGLPVQFWPPRRWGLSGFEVVRLSGLAIAIGLGLFLAMPRLPGFQIQMLPVSGSLSLPDDFDSSQVFNPGLSSSNLLDSGDLSDAQLDELLQSGNGEATIDTYFGFSNRLDLGLVGRVQIEPRTVLRVRSQAPSFWRMVAFDRYTGTEWQISRRDDAVTLDRSASGRFLLRSPLSRLPQEQVVQTYTVVYPLPSTIPSVQAPRTLIFPSPKIGLDAEGNLRSPVGLPEGLTFSVISRVPRRDRTRLKEAIIALDDTTRTHYLQLPDDLDPRIADLAAEVMAEGDNSFDKSLILGQYLKQNYRLRPTPPIDRDREVTSEFLFERDGGRAEQFSTALAVMLRSQGIPARLVAGFQPGQFNPFTGYYVVSSTDASTLVEIFLPTYGWFLIDPVPGRDLLPPTLSDTEPFSALKAFWTWFAGLLPPPIAAWFGTTFAWLFSGLASLWQRLGGWMQALGWWSSVLWLGLGFVVVLLGIGAVAIARSL
ncbi:MAG: transglutaminaseTgpA domain-containing protein, partial [Cyanobacteria bacterium J06639_1]